MDGRIAVLKHTRGPWDFERYQVPDPEPGALIVKITYANVCGSDLHWWRGENAIDPRGRCYRRPPSTLESGTRPSSITPPYRRSRF